MKNTSIVLGYGVFVKPNPDYQKYLDIVLNDIVEDRPDLIITCGGCSHKNYPDLSEAESVKNYFLDLHPEIESKIVTENKSLSTPQNLEFSKKLFLPADSVTVYCDSCRVPKVFYLCISLFFDTLSEKEKLEILANIYISKMYDFSREVKLEYKNITIIGIPLSNNMSIISQQIISSMLEMHSFDYPDFHQRFIAWRKKQWGVK